MKWRICKLFKIEKTKITYIVDGKTFKTSHTFKIYNINTKVEGELIWHI